MLLKNIDAHDSNSGGRAAQEEVVLAPVYYFSEPKAAIARFQNRFPHVKFLWHTMQDKFQVDDGQIPDEDWRRATILLTFGHSPRSLSQMPNLKFIQLLSSGHDHMLNTPVFSDPSIPAASSSGVAARAIAQHSVLQILSFAHSYPKALQVLEKKKHWIEADEWPFQTVLEGARVGIMGYGAIGRQVARILHAMGMQIIACAAEPLSTPESRRHTGIVLPGSDDAAMGDREGVLPSEWHSGDTKANLHKFLGADLDYLAIFAPLTETTMHSLGREEFDLLGQQKKPFLLNVSRGKIVVQDEMIAALKDGRLAGAALDVADPEPLPAENELWRLPNVTLTSHMAWAYKEYIDDALKIFAENLARLEKDERLLNEVDRRTH